MDVRKNVVSAGLRARDDDPVLRLLSLKKGKQRTILDSRRPILGLNYEPVIALFNAELNEKVVRSSM